jgi:AraC family ethanolamine operon transcriptional activator
MRTFAILDPAAPEIEWCGRPFNSSQIGIFAKHGEFQSISKLGFDVFTLSFIEEQLALAGDRIGVPGILDILVSSEALHDIDQRQVSVLQHEVNEAVRILYRPTSEMNQRKLDNHFRDSIADRLVTMLTTGSRLLRTPSQQTQSRILRCALEIIDERLDEAISVEEITIKTGISRPTLEYAFRNRYDFSPKIFINSQRLVAVRKELKMASNETPIAHIANRWGYWHMGQFARDYRCHFGELPSRTSRPKLNVHNYRDAWFRFYGIDRTRNRKATIVRNQSRPEPRP